MLPLPLQGSQTSNKSSKIITKARLPPNYDLILVRVLQSKTR
jgi:hypothetical protein